MQNEKNHKNTELEENSKGKSLFKWQNQKLKHIKRMDNNCQVFDLVQAFAYLEAFLPKFQQQMSAMQQLFLCCKAIIFLIYTRVRIDLPIFQTVSND